MVVNKYKANNIFILSIFLFFILLMFSGLRPIGFDSDSTGYFEMMKNIVDDNFDGAIEPTFLWITKISYYLLGGDYYKRFSLFIYALINISFIVFAIKKLSINLFFSILIYALLFYPILTLTQIRFGVASAIFLFAIHNIYNKNLFLYLFQVLIAILFHLSAIMLFPFYLLNGNRINKKYYVFLFILSIIVIFINTNLKYILLDNLNYFPNFIVDKLYVYLYVYGENSKFSEINIFNSFSLFIMSIYLFSLYYIEKFKSKYSVLLVKILGWGIFLYTLSSFFPTFSIRILNIFGLVSIVLLVEINYLFKQKYLIYISTGLLLILMFLNINVRHELLNFGIFYE
jgi:hypothetical protein